ncbi:hypothetical protein D0S45_11575 [Marinifilum sp. JC120]|nr:hypothetical protein D0S45_11575 [Marinifilum sp. JC120]
MKKYQKNNGFTIPAYILTLSFLAAMWQLWHYAPMLPTEIVTKFGNGGRPQEYESSSTFINQNFLLYCFLTGSALLFRYFGIKFPDKFVNLPNREYWLAPKRKNKTYRRLTNFVYLFFASTILCSLSMTQLIIDANLYLGTPFSNLTAMMFILSYCAIVCGLLIYIFRKFRITNSQKN